MNLNPVRPPGPNARKARAFAAEILQLRAQGYTFEAIREALAGAGVQVSNSTVQREVARAAQRSPGIRPADAAASHRGARPQSSIAATAAHARKDDATATAASSAVRGEEGANELARGLGGRESAEAFFDTHHSNPLFANKETS